MGRRGSASLAWGILAGMAFAFLGVGRQSLAGHYSYEVSGDCYQCHNLSPNPVATDPNTSYILNGSFLSRMKYVWGNTPEVFGCTYCHQYTGNRVMKDVFFPFKTGASFHPVDLPYTLDGNRNVIMDYYSTNEFKAIYVSNWPGDNQWSNYATQIDCRDCHDVNLDGATYPNHSALWTDCTATTPDSSKVRYSNPFMLKNVTSANSPYGWANVGTVNVKVTEHAPDAFCLLTCHNGNANANYKMGHYGWGARGSDNVLKEPSGTPLKNRPGGGALRCADCHETHKSQRNGNLFADNQQVPSQAYLKIDTANCTNVCHDDTTFLDSGHKNGNASGFTCVTCHSATVSHRDMDNPRRLSGVVDTNSASLTQALDNNGRDDNYDGVIDDAAEATFAYSMESSCRTCHSAYTYHLQGGFIPGASFQGKTSSCLNCHDPHGKGIGNNIKMIRTVIMGENTVYTSRSDMWRSADDKGICNNPTCHGGKPMGTETSVINKDNNTIMGAVSAHTDNNTMVTYQTDCTGCHTHTAEGGSFKPMCNGCHDYPQQSHLSTSHALSEVHNIHANPKLAAKPTNVPGYDFPCTTCHYTFTHNNMGITRGLDWNASQTGLVQVVFDPAYDPDATAYYQEGATPATGQCFNVTCHGAKLPLDMRRDMNTTPTWNGSVSCGVSCHRVTTLNTFPESGAHAKHVSTGNGYGYGCQICHYDTTADGQTVPMSSWKTYHVNVQADVKFRTDNAWVSGGSYTGAPTIGDDNVGISRCANIYCHSPGSAKTAPFDNGALGAPDWYEKDWNANDLACNACHAPATNSHPKHLADGFSCRVCHYETTSSSTGTTITNRSLHVNGADNVAYDNAWHSFDFDGAGKTCGTAVCHGGTAPVWGAAGPIGCDVCHKNTNGAASTADVDDFRWDDGVMSKIRDADWTSRGHGLATGALPWSGGGTPSSTFGRAMACLDCHDNGLAVRHDNTANPFRFKAAIGSPPVSVVFDNVNTVCYACHSGAAVQEHSKAVTGGGSSGRVHSQKCVDCHDVHGEGNILMVHDNIVWQDNTSTTDRATSNDYGVPYFPASRATVVFTDNASGADYASTNGAAPYDGICEVCHENTSWYRRSAPLTGPQGHSQDKCTTCHQHDAGFKGGGGGGCAGCHGSTTLGQYWPAASPGSRPNRAGAHDNHVGTIGFWLYAETSASPGLLDNTAKGTSDAKQKSICAWCHPNPGDSRAGTSESGHWDAAEPADVHGDGRAGASPSYLAYYNGNLVTPGYDNDTAATYDCTTRSCSNARCHNNVATPSGANDWRTPPAWSSAGCGTAQCHATPAASGAHVTHYSSASGKGYACTQCHVIPSDLRHANGRFDLSFTNAGSLEQVYGGGNGSYAKADNTAYKTANGVCNNIYCHGGDGSWGGSDTTPVWDNVSTGDCGTCHASVSIPTGNHTVHLDNAASAYGPKLGGANCAACHANTALSDNTHVDGTPTFRNDNASVPWSALGSSAPRTATDNGSTDRCTGCHSDTNVTGVGVGTILAKGNWDNAAYQLACLTCHNAAYPAYDNVGKTGIRAPSVDGDGTNYGATVGGHGRQGTAYASGNKAANQPCTACHDATEPHVNHVNDDTYSGNRLLGTVNGRSGLSTITAMCDACHANATSPADQKSINTHGNTSAAFKAKSTHDPNAQDFAYNCDACHEPHGLTLNGRTGTSANIFMVKKAVEIRNISVGDVAPDNTTVVDNVVFEARSGNFSFDDNQMSSSYNRVCVACHVSGQRPGSASSLTNAAGDGTHAGLSDYNKTEQRNDCSSCHSHNLDDNTATVDGMMPQQCNACHSYPGLDNSAPGLGQMSRGHWDHVGNASGVSASRGFACTLCHLNFNHNASQVLSASEWGAKFSSANVDIRFESSWNPVNANGPRYNGILADAANGTVGNGGTGICAGLYCHGDSAALSGGWGGSDNTPQWSVASTGACGTCHRADSGLAQGNHPVHLDNVSKPYGPETWRFFGVGSDCSDGTGCHTKYGLAPASWHVNKEATMRSTATDNGEVGATLATTQVCRNCHPTYISPNVPTSGDALVRTQANWDNPSYFVDCLTCHNGTAAGTQATANLDGSGGVAHAIEGTIYTMQHGIQGVGCGWCHGDSGHIGTRRPVGSDPYRLTGYFFTGSYAPVTQLGQIDYACKYCHDMFGPADHAWRVSGSGSSGPETKETTDTHPTTVPAVAAGKDRWYQVPSGAQVPLFGDLLDNNYNRTGGSNNYVLCVSCHDPHGVGTSPLAPSVRRFSGQNTDAGGNKALRFNYSSGTPTALCSQCHL